MSVYEGFVHLQEASVGKATAVGGLAADHLFLFLIQDDQNGTILFMGQVPDTS